MVNQTHPGYAPYLNIIYVDNGVGDDNNGGSLPNRAIKTLSKAIALATAVGKPYQCIILMPSQTAYHDDTGETYGYAIPAACDDLTIMSASAVPGACRHTVIGASDEGSTSGILYSLAENTTLINLSFISNKTPVFLGTETTHGSSTNTVTAGAYVKGCTFDTTTTASQEALSASCTNAVFEDSEFVSNGATSCAVAINDPATFVNCRFQFLVDGIQQLGGATYNTRVHDCLFEVKAGTAAFTGYAVDILAGSNDVHITGCYVAPDSDGDATASFGEDDGTYTGKITIIDNVGVTAVVTPGAGAGDKTATTTAIATVEAY